MHNVTDSGYRRAAIVPAAEHREAEMARYKKLGYVALNVRDLARSGEFYQDDVGLAFSGTGPGGELFLRCSAGHHDLILYPAG